MARRRRKYTEPEAAELSIDGLTHEGDNHVRLRLLDGPAQQDDAAEIGI